MIRREDLLPIAKLKGLPIGLAELDYLQEIALINIYREFGNKLIFKGGTCLYKLYRLNRFSEDLDFSVRKGFSPKDFFSRLPYLFGLLNINSKVNVEQFEQSINIHQTIMGPLYDGRKDTLTTLLFNISLRDRVVLDTNPFSYSSLYKELRPFDLFAMSEKEIMAEKIRAIYSRNKARDVYDFWYLLKIRGIGLDIRLANKKLSHQKMKFEKDNFLKKIEEKRSSWGKDLGALISGELPRFNQVENDLIGLLAEA
jgi:hypothetical protein